MPRVALPNGSFASFPDDMKPAEIEAVLQKQFPPTEPAPAKSAPFSLARAGESLKKTVRVATGLDEPQGPTDMALQAVTSGKIIGSAPGALGRVATAAGLGAGRAAVKGEPIGWGALIDAAVAAGTEGVAKVVQSGSVPLSKWALGHELSLKELGAAARGFKYATEAPAKALEMIKGQLPKVKLLIPALGKTKLTPDEIVKKLATLEGDAYALARDQVADAFNQAAAAAPHVGATTKQFGDKAGDVFKKFTSEFRRQPGVGSKAAEAAREALSEPALRAGMDAVAEEKKGGVPVGAIAGLGALGSFGDFAHRVRLNP